MIERTLVLLKPDAPQRRLMGQIITRFENAGFKIVACKFIQTTEERALNHYTQDITDRLGQHVRDALVKMLVGGPVMALVIEGVEVVANVRRLVGATQSSSAAPGSIRGDFSHASFAWADEKEKALYNLVHASADLDDAKNEIPVWFEDAEIVDFKMVDEYYSM